MPLASKLSLSPAASWHQLRQRWLGGTAVVDAIVGGKAVLPPLRAKSHLVL
jgi:hypothetical protein